MPHAIIRSCLAIIVAATCTIGVRAIGTAHAERGLAAALVVTNDLKDRFESERFATEVSAGGIHTCALLDNHTIKCWGGNGNGQLGQGDPNYRGDGPGEMGDNLPPIDLGTGRTALAVAAGDRSTCALLDSGAVKCWGRGSFGELGQGDTVWRGDNPGEMGDNLPAIDLGTGRTARAIASGRGDCVGPGCPGKGGHNCALLDDGSVKCWGDNTSGVLGYGDSSNRGDGPGEMGDNLAPIDLGTGRTARAVTAGYAHTCVLLDDYTVKCWGDNTSGQLGQGDTNTRGDSPGEMGDNLVPIDLGAGRTATAISAGRFLTCALLDIGSVKCWGSGGTLGQGDGNTRGDNPSEMGDSLNPIDLGIGRTATAISAGANFGCAALDNGTAKCWGGNFSGQLGQGDTNNRGVQPGEMGDNLAPIDLGAGRTASTIRSGTVHTCALLAGGTVKCWGFNSDGELGQGHLQWLGTYPGQLGDQLAPVDLGTGRPPPVFSSIAPVRVLDTRDGLGVGTPAPTGPAPVSGGTSIAIPVTGVAPADAVAVVVNLTTTRSGEAGFLTIHPCGEAVPEASNLNFRPGFDSANLAIAPVSSSGTICVYTSATTDLIADITGYTTTGYQPTTPTRLADTRQTTPQAADTTLRVALPLGGGHVVTVTATRATEAGFLTAYDCAQSRPDTSIVNYIPGVDTANLTIATGTDLCVYTSADVDVIVDDHGRISGTASESQRLIDTRVAGTPLEPGQTVMIPNTATDGTSRAINITATQAAEAGFFTLHPCNTPPPTTSALNYAPGRDIANLAIIPTTQDTCITTSATTHLIIDLAATIS